MCIFTFLLGKCLGVWALRAGVYSVFVEIPSQLSAVAVPTSLPPEVNAMSSVVCWFANCVIIKNKYLVSILIPDTQLLKPVGCLQWWLSFVC